MAKTDPLGLDDRKMPIELDPQLYGFSDKDLDRECALQSRLFCSDILSHPSICWSILQLLVHLIAMRHERMV